MLSFFVCVSAATRIGERLEGVVESDHLVAALSLVGISLTPSLPNTQDWVIGRTPLAGWVVQKLSHGTCIGFVALVEPSLFPCFHSPLAPISLPAFCL